MRHRGTRTIRKPDASASKQIPLYPVDIVIPWVNSDDPAWQARYHRYLPETLSGADDAGAERYRDWDLLRYWFRGIEQFCPWVRTIHFITEGHLPEWLNTDHPKLHIVNHSDYIPAANLPTFNSHVIENNMHMIDGLAERFVYFNDDFFVTAPCTVDHFFPDGLPAGIATPSLPWNDDLLTHVSINATGLLNRNFDKANILKRDWRKWLNPRYGARANIQAASLLPWKYISPFYIHHLPQAYIKSVFPLVWEAAESELLETNRSRFRRFSDLNQYIFYYWQICSGLFNPVSPITYGKTFKLGVDDDTVIETAVRSGSQVLLCINDGPVKDVPKTGRRLQQAFESLLPAVSSYEK